MAGSIPLLLTSVMAKFMQLDFFSAKVRRDPYETYVELRGAGDAYYDRTTDSWFVGRYAAVKGVLQNNADFSNSSAGVESTLLGADGAKHSRTRKLVQPAFTAEKIEALATPLLALARQLAKHLGGPDPVETVSKFALLVPTTGIAWMLGIDEDRAGDLARWSAAILRTSDARRGDSTDHRTMTPEAQPLPPGNPSLEQDPRLGTPEDPELLECHDFLLAHFERAHQNGSRGWLTDIIASQGAGFTPEEMLNIALLMIVAGTETTTDLIGNALLFLARNPDIYALIQKNESLMTPFIDEVLRFDSPVQRRPRYAVVDTMIGDQPILAGARVELILGAANRDPDQFEDPDCFRLTRRLNRHTTFGAGAHFCLGSELAKVEAKAALWAILERYSAIGLCSDPQGIDYPANLRRRGPCRLHLRFYE